MAHIKRADVVWSKHVAAEERATVECSREIAAHVIVEVAVRKHWIGVIRGCDAAVLTSQSRILSRADRCSKSCWSSRAHIDFG